MKQLGLSMHNYEGTYGQFPMASVWTVTAPTSPTTYIYAMGWGQAILPYMDQAPLFNAFDYTQPIWSGANNQSLIAKQLTAHLCPSTPAIPTTSTTWLASPLRGNPSVGLAPAADLVVAAWGRSDYIVPTDVRSPLYYDLSAIGGTTLTRHGFFYMGDTNAGAVTSFVPAISGTSFDGSPTIAKVTDGLTNTIMIAEKAGRNQLWENGQLYTAGNPDADPADFAAYLSNQNNYAGGGWADPNNNEWLDGSNRNGMVGGYNKTVNGDASQLNSCAINCNNLTAHSWYSWHIGTINVAMGDGSVRTISQNIADVILASLITRAGAEPLGEF